MDKNLSAFTPCEHPYPQYVSINVRDGAVAISVRSPPDADGNCGSTSEMRMTPEQFESLVHEALKNLNE